MVVFASDLGKLGILSRMELVLYAFSGAEGMTDPMDSNGCAASA